MGKKGEKKNHPDKTNRWVQAFGPWAMLRICLLLKKIQLNCFAIQGEDATILLPNDYLEII
jgi:hypothetical protein